MDRQGQGQRKYKMGKHDIETDWQKNKSTFLRLSHVVINIYNDIS